MKRVVKVKAHDPSQNTIKFMFAKASTPTVSSTAATATATVTPAKVEKAAAAPVVATAAATAVATATLKSDDPVVQEYYNQLKPAEVIAHTIAVDKLGTSYDVVRTHGFLRWMKARASTAAGGAGSSTPKS